MPRRISTISPVVGVAHHRDRIVREHAGHRRQVGRRTGSSPEQSELLNRHGGLGDPIIFHMHCVLGALIICRIAVVGSASHQEHPCGDTDHLNFQSANRRLSCFGHRADLATFSNHNWDRVNLRRALLRALRRRGNIALRVGAHMSQCQLGTLARRAASSCTKPQHDCRSDPLRALSLGRSDALPA